MSNCNRRLTSIETSDLKNPDVLEKRKINKELAVAKIEKNLDIVDTFSFFVLDGVGYAYRWSVNENKYLNF